MDINGNSRGERAKHIKMVTDYGVVDLYELNEVIKQFMDERDSDSQVENKQSVEEWIAYWRKNPEKFFKDCHGTKLKWYQKLIIRFINKIDNIKTSIRRIRL